MHDPAMPAVSALFSGPVSVGLLAGVVSGLFYLVVAGIRWAGRLRAARERQEQLRHRRRLQSQTAAAAVATAAASRRSDGASEQGGVDDGEGDFDAPRSHLRDAREQVQVPRVRHASTASVGGDNAGGQVTPDNDNYAGDINARPREVKQQSGEWLYRQVQRRLHPAPSERSLCSVDDGLGMEPETARVREFIERLVESLVSGELDNVCVKRLHSHPDYDRMFACHHAPLCEALARLSFALQMAIVNRHMDEQDSPSTAHAALKQLVHQIIREAMTLPKFKVEKPSEDDVKLFEDMESKTYEDILATAILNKVIERYQQRNSSRTNLDGNSNVLSPELSSLVSKYQPQLLSYFESGERSQRSSDGGIYSNDCDDMSELSSSDPLAVTIEECIEEVTTISNAEDDADDIDEQLPSLDIFKNTRAQFPEYGRDIVDVGAPVDTSESDEEEDTEINPTDAINPVDSWEENWLFQKRRLKVGGVAQPMPVPMLVPNPSEDYRARIGDRDAEDVSDLSDCSDGVLEDIVLAEEDRTSPFVSNPDSVQSVVDSTENSVVNVEELPAEKKNQNHENNIADDGLLLMNDRKCETHGKGDLTEARNVEYFKSTADDCLSEFGQQEGEYTEDYAAVTQRQLDSLTGTSDPDSVDIPELPSTPIPQLSSDTSTMDESVIALLKDLVPGESETDQPSISPLPDLELSKPPRPGTIAEREHKKWECAPPIPNNPYSPENINKRLNRRQGILISSKADTSISNDTPEQIVEEPLQVICSPVDVDYSRYGRDYYINAQAANNRKKDQPNASSEQQLSTLQCEESLADVRQCPSNKKLSKPIKTSSNIHDSNTIESGVDLWQEENSEADHYYKNILNKKEIEVDDSAEKDYYNVDSSSFYQSMLSNGNGFHYTDDNVKSKDINKRKGSQNGFEKLEVIERVNTGKSVSELKAKFDEKNKKSDSSLESAALHRRNGNMGSNLSLLDNSDIYTNGFSRSDSPSGSSVLTSDSDGLPSVRELTKRFSAIGDSDSSTSSPKSVSPAPQWRKKEHWLKKKEDIKAEPKGIVSDQNQTRAVREVHSLTARSISREFREELRHNQPVPLNKNVYKQINPKNVNGLQNDIEENQTSNKPNITSKSPVPCRSMKSNIAFWEQMQKNKT